MAYPALSSLTQRVITGVILLALFLSALFFSSNIVWMVVVSLVTLLTAGELGKLLAASGYERFGMSVAPH
ncbi:MAG: hypothetical protein LBG61_00810, partial [Burkholderiales bacterium]|nr:hypothetical protein [Burkholderiales bacterium]